MTETTRNQQDTTTTARPGVPAPRSPSAPQSRPSGWTGWVVFGGAMLILSGAFQVVLGLVALLDDGLFVVRPSGLVLDVDYTTWGWAHLAIGVLAILLGLGLLAGNLAARIVGVALAGVSALANLAFIPAYPIWSTIVIAVDVLIIYAIVVHGDELRSR
ncbi:hypothetical protein SAMN05660748_0971 [Blastococcus aggregatus]|uniref:DUF7144 domain-containing protein n=1 Tax=Blastococcus aggregatus TaxID=38502 RepID=A0A285V0Y3_9ACTN|nr:hypothetical protein [Blastococcus aggregatus]SOC47703.1 hypothetical protein SAMN05660748_0971 [Blastococcus aggregatus]